MNVKLMLVLLVSAFLIACNQTVEQSSAVDAPLEGTVELENSAFSPNTVTIKRGGTVTFENNDATTHTVTSDSFDSGDLAKGETFEQTFTKTGSYSIKCKYHPGMMMKVIVK